MGGPARAMCSATVTSSPLEPNPAPAIPALRPLSDQFDAGRVERRDELHQRIDISADHPFAGFHPLDRRHREAGQLRQLSLIEAGQSASRSELGSSNHASNIIFAALIRNMNG